MTVRTYVAWGVLLLDGSAPTGSDSICAVVTLQLDHVFYLERDSVVFQDENGLQFCALSSHRALSMKRRAFLLISTLNAKSLHELSFFSDFTSFRYGLPLLFGWYLGRDEPVQHLLVWHSQLSNFVLYVFSV